LLAPALFLSALPALPQQQATSAQSNDPIDQLHVSYGISINLADARKVIAAAAVMAQKQKWEMAIAVVDISGELVSFDRLDGTENAAVQMAIGKAQTAVLYRRPTKAFEDRLAQGGDNLRILGMKGVVPVDGGVPIVVGGRSLVRSASPADRAPKTAAARRPAQPFCGRQQMRSMDWSICLFRLSETAALRAIANRRVSTDIDSVRVTYDAECGSTL
jgi:uncharacterized protein GlcG (DUF336 family)